MIVDAAIVVLLVSMTVFTVLVSLHSALALAAHVGRYRSHRRRHPFHTRGYAWQATA